MAGLSEFAPAKVNLTLRVVDRRADGYHDLESLVVFANIGDTLVLVPGDDLGLVVDGPRAAATGDISDNLVLRAARELSARHVSLRVGQFILDKQLPVAAGLGGGSADAAAALRLLARANDMQLGDPRLFEAARATGADVPVCLWSHACLMEGVGDVLSESLAVPVLPYVLVNPGVAVATKDVFAALAMGAGGHRPSARIGRFPPLGRATGPEPMVVKSEFIEWLSGERNDLEPAAISLQPIIGQVLDALRAQPGCQLTRMSGSGATCFGLFDDEASAAAAAKLLARAQPDWWVRADVLS
jgi:4-diphosphocytidyl-2-C-methyl-D-erythritol kinase